METESSAMLEVLETANQDATLEDVERLMELQELVRESYAEIGRLRKKVKRTTARRREDAAKAQAARDAEIKRLSEAARRVKWGP